MADSATWIDTCPLRIWLNGQPRGAILKLSQGTGLNCTTLRNWMQNVTSPSLRHLLVLEAATGTPVEDWVAWARGRGK